MTSKMNKAVVQYETQWHLPVLGKTPVLPSSSGPLILEERATFEVREESSLERVCICRGLCAK